MESKTLAANAAEPASPERNGLFSWYGDAQPRARDRDAATAYTTSSLLSG